jgi:predicted regulator of Ras-like GTPase activity (Roadblock/LC7/MglB family)
VPAQTAPGTPPGPDSGPDSGAGLAPAAATASGTEPGSAPAPAPAPGVLSHEARNLQWLLHDFVDEDPGARSVAVVSSDGLLLLASDAGQAANPRPGDDVPAAGAVGAAGALGTPPGPAAPGGPPAQVGEARLDLAAVVSGLASLTVGAAKLMDGGRVRQTTVAMEGGLLVVMSISDGSLLGVHAAAGSDITVIAYHMALFVSRAGHVLTPALRGELRQAMETSG